MKKIHHLVEYIGQKHKLFFPPRNGYLTKWKYFSRIASRSRHWIPVGTDVTRRSLGTGELPFSFRTFFSWCAFANDLGISVENEPSIDCDLNESQLSLQRE